MQTFFIWEHYACRTFFLTLKLSVKNILSPHVVFIVHKSMKQDSSTYSVYTVVEQVQDLKLN